MNAPSRRGIRSLASVGAALAGLLLAPVPAAAEVPPRVPDVFEAAWTTLAGEDKLEYACEGTAESTNDTLFIAASVGADHTPASEVFLVSFKFNREVYAALRAGSVDVTVSPVEESPLFEFVFKLYLRFDDQPPPPGSILRTGWASWGAKADCRFTHNGRVIEGIPQPAERATYALPTDFSGGVAATAAAGWSVGTVGALQSYPRSSTGYLHALLATDMGTNRATGPEGQAYEESGDLPWIGIAEPTNGEWRYAFDGASGDQGAVLWIMELPASPTG